MEQLTLVAPTLFGLEGVCAEELKRLDARNVRAENGRVLWDYTPGPGQSVSADGGAGDAPAGPVSRP